MLRTCLNCAALLCALPLSAAAQNAYVIVDEVYYPAQAGFVGEELAYNGIPAACPWTIPLQLVQAIDQGGVSESDGCEPLANVGEIRGNVAFMERGTCSFADKASHAAAAGAVAFIVYQDDRVLPDDETLVTMGRACEPERCPVAGAFVSRATALELIDQGLSGVRMLADDNVLCSGCDYPAAWIGELTTETVSFSVYNDGYLGSNPRTRGFAGDPIATPMAPERNGAVCSPLPSGFRYNFVGGLWHAEVLIAQGDRVVSAPPGTESQITRASGEVLTLTPPFDAPFDQFEQGVEAPFLSAQTLNLDATIRGYARTSDDFVAVEIAVSNPTAAMTEEIYVGVGAALDAWFDATLEAGLLSGHVYGGAMGILLLDENEISGWTLDLAENSEAELLAALSSPGDATIEYAYHTVLGTGPYTLAPGETVTVPFVFVAGDDATDLLANAELARSLLVVDAETNTPDDLFALDAAFPNPFASTTALRFALPTAQQARLTVYDILGREVLTLTDGVQPAGVQTVTLDGTGLPSGSYVVRLHAEIGSLTRRVTVLR
ncbi:MAG: PA domain-containing protein [Bacteroidota bacterium]